MKKHWKSVLVIAVFTALILLPLVPVHAQNDIGSGLNSIQQPFSGGGFRNVQTVGDVIREVIRILLYFTGIIGVLMLIYGGYQYITAGGNEEQAEKGRKILTNVVLGIALVGFSYVIVTVAVNFIQGRTG